jgi:hypothetical protein
MHAEAERTARELLPDIVGGLLEVMNNADPRAAQRGGIITRPPAAREPPITAWPSLWRNAPFDHGVDREVGLEL